MVFILDRIVTLDMHVMARNGTGYCPVGSKSQSIAVQSRFLTGAMAKIYSVALLAHGVVVRLELFLGPGEGEPAFKIRLRGRMTDRAIGIRTVGRYLPI